MRGHRACHYAHGVRRSRMNPPGCPGATMSHRNPPDPLAHERCHRACDVAGLNTADPTKRWPPQQPRDQGRRRDHGVADRGVKINRAWTPCAGCHAAPERSGPARRGRGVDEEPPLRGRRPELPARPTSCAGARLATIDEGSKAPWGFALQKVMDALSRPTRSPPNPRRCSSDGGPVGREPGRGMSLFTEDLAKGRIAMTTSRRRSEAATSARRREPSCSRRADPDHPVQPTTTRSTRPLVITRRCINKYYILDLQRRNAFVGHAVARATRLYWRLAQRRHGRAADLGRIHREAGKGDRGGAGVPARTGEHARVRHGGVLGQWRAVLAGGAAAGRQHDPVRPCSPSARRRLGLIVNSEMLARGRRDRQGGGSRAASSRRCSPPCGQRPHRALRRQGLPQGPGPPR